MQRAGAVARYQLPWAMSRDQPPPADRVGTDIGRLVPCIDRHGFGPVRAPPGS